MSLAPARWKRPPLIQVESRMHASVQLLLIYCTTICSKWPSVCNCNCTATPGLEERMKCIETKVEAAASIVKGGLEERMKCIETKVEVAASIMKGLSDRVDKVCLASGLVLLLFS